MAESEINVSLDLDTEQARKKLDDLRAKTPLIARVIGYCQGKTTSWLLGFFAIGNTLQFLHRLDATYITFMTAFMGIALGHSIKEDYFSKGGN